MSQEKICVKLPTTDKKVTLLKWRVKEGTLVNSTVVVLLYQENGEKDRKSFRTHHVGVVKKILIHEGQEVPAGYPVFELEPGCSHSTVVSDLCADCGADLRIDNASKPTASVSMVHSVPDLKVSEQSALLLGKADEKRLLGDKKLVLLVDLDQTLIHTTNDNIPNNIKDIHHFQLYGPNSPWYHTRLRPGTYNFLSSISELYELHICTFGARNYAHTITHILDPKGKLFSHRVLSRDECFNPNSKTGNLKGLFPCGDNMVCIIDDREDVWDYALNLIHVKPYHFFQHTGDINAPPNLQKNVDISLQQDNRVDFTHLVQGITIKKKDNIKGDPQMEDGEVLSDDDSGNTTTDNEEKNKNDAVIEDNSDQVEVEEEDDYLLYLEDILKNLHKEYFKEYDQNYELYGNNVEVPDMKRIIPTYRSKILAGKKLVFSGLVPTPVPLTESRAYKVARLLGAEVTENIKPDSTHLVAVRQGTLKASAARKRPDIKTVTPEWLWLCAERWEHVEERLFPLRSEGGGGSSSRDPPAHCSSPEHSPHFMANNQNISHVNKEQDQKFAETLNPLLSFSDEDIKRMAGEVEDMTDDEESCDGDDVPDIIDVLKINKDGNSSSEASLDGTSRGQKRRRSSLDSDGSEEDNETLNEKFRQGKNLDDLGVEWGNNSENSVDPPDEMNDSDWGNNSENSVDPPDEMNDSEWNMLGAALEKEFLENQ
ncbi:RNA polymerase II subunit A C-terminal domain phosphatase isoform X3 [Acyrthosiphon pisum]|uniref:RNA polymerase II subunit A C-terminal domain phosphatase n=1 Tax=Acyrthosiphon pisum TaxID=7029 RepID=A0A8R2F9K1_ACYPI|nr:RNA polymerase II subunit A C-terminal domain phosphatase isoform X3 [Acyrthosiphon pisum]|eukprot:XP_008183934.1 PREDICTED: RNA polymerase II subunit A C-terminal domain phosphatase isoform X3 [Acyrthosiphon pisum]